jgi:hypothetical protein
MNWRIRMLTYKIHIVLIRSFGVGFKIIAPKFNGWLCVEFYLGCFELHLWKRGRRFFKASNLWR